MSNYRLLDVDVSRGRMTVDYLDGVYIHMAIPRANGQWLTGPDFDRYVRLQHPTQREDPGAASENYAVWSEDRLFAAESQTGQQPQDLPLEVEDRVIAYKQLQFMSMVDANKFAGGPWVFDQEGSHVWTVPPDLPWVRIAIFSSGQATWELGPGVFWGRGCSVPVGETVSIELGQTTVVTSSLGSLTVGSGWGAAGQVPQELYKTMAWGHVGRPGAVIIY